MRIPRHIGVIPDGNRRWAIENGMTKEMGYNKGLDPGLKLFKLCEKEGIEEITYYGFTVDNTKRPKVQRLAFTEACIEAVKMLAKENATLSSILLNKVIFQTESQCSISRIWDKTSK